MTDLHKIRAAQVQAAEAAAIADLPPELLNGMTEQETAQTASVAGLTAAIQAPEGGQAPGLLHEFDQLLQSAERAERYLFKTPLPVASDVYADLSSACDQGRRVVAEALAAQPQVAEPVAPYVATSAGLLVDGRAFANTNRLAVTDEWVSGWNALRAALAAQPEQSLSLTDQQIAELASTHPRRAREPETAWLCRIVRAALAAQPQAAPELEAENKSLRAQVAALSREAWEWSKALEAQLKAAPDDQQSKLCPICEARGRADAAPQEAPEVLTDAQVDRLYANVPPSAQQDARSREAFRRIVRVVEAAHGILAPQTKEPANDR